MFHEIHDLKARGTHPPRWLPRAGRAAMAAVIPALIAVAASAHEAPSGWTYDRACCSDQDCRPALASEVTTTAEGYRVQVGDFETVLPWGHRKVRESGDLQFHVCLGPEFVGLYCLYVPPLSF